MGRRFDWAMVLWICGCGGQPTSGGGASGGLDGGGTGALDGAARTIDGKSDGGTRPPDLDAMVEIPAAGAFWMGCNEAVDADCFVDEFPRHEVMLPAFRIDRTEVTTEAYLACMSAGACFRPALPGDQCNLEDNWTHSPRYNHPINCVSWQNAVDFCAWAGKRLPTEAEWEMAARGTDGRIYPWGNEPPTCTLANYLGCSNSWTELVAQYPDGASPFGALDMAGNVWEWVADWYQEDYYDVSPTTDPRGPASGTLRVKRGGAWSFAAGNVRASNRSAVLPDDFGNSPLTYGFRCAWSD